jgi:hypothetical protein
MKAKEILIFDRAGKFAQNKDIGKAIRTQEILPELKKGGKIVLNFGGVEAATQSFIHSLISEALRQHKDALDRITFKSCNEIIKKLIAIVVDYMQDATEKTS